GRGVGCRGHPPTVGRPDVRHHRQLPPLEHETSYNCPMDLQELLDEASAILEAPVTLEDRGLRLLAFAAHDTTADHVRVETVLGRGAGPRTREWFESFDIARARGPVHVPAHPERGIAARLCLPARARGVV